MAKLTGYNKVAVIRIGFGAYHFAIYDDGFDYQPGDVVFTSGNGDRIGKIEEIITAEETANRFNKNITAEVICKIDTSAYDKRVENRQNANKIKKRMEAIIKKVDVANRYEIYVELKELEKFLEKL